MAPVPTSRRLMMAIATGVVAFAFWPALFGGGSLLSADIVATSPPFDAYQPESFSLENGPGDPINIHAHWASLADDIRHGEFSWWNPELAAGQPTMKAGLPVFNVPYLAVPAWYAPGLVAAIRVLAAVGLAYGFLRSHRLHRLSSLVGGVAFGFSGFMVGWMNWPHSSVAALAPGLLWAIERLVRDPRPWRAVPLGGVVALMVWANFPSVTIYVLLGAGAYAAIRVGEEWRRAGGARWVVPRAAVGAVAVVVTALLAGPHLIGFSEYVDWADTSHRIGNPDDSSAGIAYLMTSVAPAIWGSDAVGPAWFGEGNWVEFNAHVGASVVLLSVFGLVSAIRSGPGRRRSLALALACVAALGVLIAYLGGPVATALGDLTGSQGGLMTRAKVLWSLGIALGAALGVERLLDGRGEARRDLLASVAVPAVGALVLVPSALDWLDAARAAGVLRETLAVSAAPALAAAATVGLVIARLRGRMSAAAAGWAVVVVVGAELLAFAMPVPTIVSAEERLTATPAHDEVVGLLAPGERLAGEGRTFFPSTTQLFDIDDARGQLLKSPGYQALLRTIDPAMLRRDGGGTPTYPNVAEGTDPTSPVWDALGVGAWSQFPDAVPAGVVTDPPAATGSADPWVQPLHGAITVPDGGLRAVLVRIEPFVGGFLDVTVETDDRVATTTRWVDPHDAGLFPVAVLGEHLRVGSDVRVTVGAPASTLLVDIDERGGPATGTVAGADGLALVRIGDVLLFDRPVAPIHLVSHVVVEPSPDAAARLVADGEHVVDRDVGLPSIPAAESARLEVVSAAFERGRIAAEIAVDQPSLLIVSQTHYPGWSATVDGSPAEVVMADAGFLGVAVEPGARDVVIEFRPDHLGISIWMLVAGLVLVTALLVDGGRRGRLRSSPSSAG